jgi:hypothetical protein
VNGDDREFKTEKQQHEREKTTDECEQVMSVCIGSDHAGFALKHALQLEMQRRMPRIEFTDVGTSGWEGPSCDYPVYAVQLCKQLAVCGAASSFVERGLACASLPIGSYTVVPRWVVPAKTSNWQSNTMTSTSCV